MSKKNKSDRHGFVFSTDPNFRYEPENDEEQVTPLPAEQKLRIRLETKHRGGKAATIIAGFIGKEEDLESLGKQLKNYCGTGGSVKEGEIIIQGDQREKVKAWLIKSGYKNSK